jgi:hypothetical protein
MTQNPDKLSQEDEKIMTDLEKEREFEKLKVEEDYIEDERELDPKKTDDFDDEISDISSVSMEDGDRSSAISDEVSDEIKAKEEMDSSIPTKEAIQPTPAPAISKKQMLLASNANSG